MQRLALRIEDTELILRLDRPEPSCTTAALRAALPFPLELHAARIAGRHVYWHAPFLAPLEAAREVTELPPGTFLFWPERQLLELLYGPLQAERAPVTVLGRLEGPLEPLAALGARLVREQGRRPFRGRLALVEGRPASRVEPAASPPALADLRAARRRLWKAPPAEIAALLARRGLVLPAGPLLMAEAEARTLQESLWALLPEAAAAPAFAAPAARLLLERAERRLRDLYGLAAAAGLLADGRAALEAAPEATLAILEELVLIAGRLAGWLDERIPWEGINEAVAAAAAAWPAAPSEAPC